MDNRNRTSQDNDQEQEYHVNSGFVNKLRSKFAQLENSNNRIVLSKRSASVENLLSDSGRTASDYSSRFKNRHGSAGRSSNDDSSINSTRSSNVILRKTTAQGYKKPERPGSYEAKDKNERPRSNEFSNRNAEKPPVSRQKETGFSKPNHLIRSVKPPLPKKNEVVTKRASRNSSSDYPPIPKIEHHDWTVAPDLEKFGRDDIIIIESTGPVEKSDKTKEKTQIDHDEIDGFFHSAKPMLENKNNEDELPKPHTVSAFRSFFEKANKASDTVRVWKGHSPTRKSTGSDVGSPRVTSPIASPRSPLEKVSDDNVFMLETDKDSQSSLSQRPSSVHKSSLGNSSPRNSVEFIPDVDTTPNSLEKSRQVFQKSVVSNEFSVNRSSPVEKVTHDKTKTKASVETSSHTLTPLHPMSEIFDSKSLKREKSNRPKPVVLARKSKEFTSSNHVSDNEIPHKNIPKDTIELKHESERKSSASQGDDLKKTVNSTYKNKAPKSIPVVSKEDVITGDTQSEDVLTESLVKPSKQKSGKISPRKTKIFDSNDMIKKNKDPPKSPVSPVPSPFTESETPAVKPKPVEVIPDTKEKTQMDVSPVRPARTKKQQNNQLPNNGMTSLKTNIVKNDTKTHADTRSPRENKPEPVFPEPKPVEKPKEVRAPIKPTNIEENTISGMSSFLASRLKKSDNDNSQLKTSSVHLANGSSPSPVPRKRQAPARPVENGFIDRSNDVEMTDKEQIPPSLPKTPEPKLPVSNIDEIIKRKKSGQQASTKLVFDSSKIATKRKDPPKRKPPRKTLQELNENVTFDAPPVPKLDLSSITGEKQETEYQEGYIPTIIKPCNFKFVGECVILQKNPYKKTKKTKVKISFDDHATTTFEYEAEESALENYLQDHPDEREEAEKQEEEVIQSAQTTEELLHDSPRAPEPDMSSIKTNTVIGASGALTSYKSKMQTQDFQFGMSMEPEEPVYDSQEPEEVNEDNMQLLPADDNELDTFSAEVGKADMLF